LTEVVQKDLTDWKRIPSRTSFGATRRWWESSKGPLINEGFFLAARKCPLCSSRHSSFSS